jgi:hypothetical protein
VTSFRASGCVLRVTANSAVCCPKFLRRYQVLQIMDIRTDMFKQSLLAFGDTFVVLKCGLAAAPAPCRKRVCAGFPAFIFSLSIPIADPPRIDVRLRPI